MLIWLRFFFLSENEKRARQAINRLKGSTITERKMTNLCSYKVTGNGKWGEGGAGGGRIIVFIFYIAPSTLGWRDERGLREKRRLPFSRCKQTDNLWKNCLHKDFELTDEFRPWWVTISLRFARASSSHAPKVVTTSGLKIKDEKRTVQKVNGDCATTSRA